MSTPLKSLNRPGVGEADAYVAPNTSLANRAGRFLWGIAWLVFMLPTPRPMFRWRAGVLRVFGAKVGPNCRIHASVRVWAPWNLVAEDAVQIGGGAEIYNYFPVTLRSHAIVSQGAFLCGATHDYDDPAFPMVGAPITLGRYAWVSARAVVCPGVSLGDGAVLGLGSIATHDLEPWTVYAGVPARPLKTRRIHPAA